MAETEYELALEDMQPEIDSLKAEIERLRAANQKMRGALQFVACDPCYKLLGSVTHDTVSSAFDES